MVNVRLLCASAWVLALYGGSARADEMAQRAWSPLYTNAPRIVLPDGSVQENCADPTVIKGQASDDPYWYALCTSDPLSDADVGPSGERTTHLLPTLRSHDLVHWEYVGDAFAAPPAWVAPTSGLWAPEIVYREGRYHLYYTAVDVADAVSGEANCPNETAIGMATSESPLGPWRDLGAPVVAPRRAADGCNFYGTLDPHVLATRQGAHYLYYGGYYGGIEVRTLSADGRVAPAESARPIVIPNRYEGAQVIEREGAYYLLVSASNCCNGPMTGYQVFAARSQSPLGPFVDREGISLAKGRVGGTPVLTLSGNRWVGPGHQTVFRDAVGDWYAMYHAVDRGVPYLADDVGLTRRPMMIDRVTWEGGWPRVRRGLGPSDSPQLAPLARAPNDPGGLLAQARRLGEAWLDATDERAFLLRLDALEPRTLPRVAAASDEFSTSNVGASFSWVRPPAAGAFAVGNGVLRMATQAAELYGDANDASVLTAPAPPGDFVVETKVELDLPDEGCCQNYVQAGLLVYGDDDTYVKLVQVSIWETRQTEFAKETPRVREGYPVYGSGVGGPAGRTTWLRLVKITRDGRDQYVSYTSRDGVRYTRGAVWTHALGTSPKIALVAMGGSGFTARFDYVRTYALGR